MKLHNERECTLNVDFMSSSTGDGMWKIMSGVDLQRQKLRRGLRRKKIMRYIHSQRL
jgi:hypothetical protein